ncbi:MAG: hypothetical protein V4719_07790 [Planctomycetota bacterium]
MSKVDLERVDYLVSQRNKGIGSHLNEVTGDLKPNERKANTLRILADLKQRFEGCREDLNEGFDEIVILRAIDEIHIDPSHEALFAEIQESFVYGPHQKLDVLKVTFERLIDVVQKRIERAQA